MTKPIQIVGGGLAGLAAAYELESAGVDYRLHESSDRWGGKVASSLVGDTLVDSAADNFLARPPIVQRLVKELNLEDQIEVPKAKDPVQIYKNGQLYSMPAGTFLGVPLKEAINLPKELADQSVPPSLDVSDPKTVGEAIRSEFSPDIADYLVEPLVGGINASEIDDLELSSATPRFKAALRTGSLSEGLRKQLDASDDTPVFYGLAGTTQALVDALVKRLDPSKIKLASKVTALEKDNSTIIALPAYSAAAVIDDKEVADELSAIEYASIAQVTAVFEPDQVTPILDSAGIVFPKCEGKYLSACSWLSSKWDRYAQSGNIILRLTTGKAGNDGHVREMDDKKLYETLFSELQEVVKTANPSHFRVVRWLNGIPTYRVGHQERVKNIRQNSKENVLFAGAAYDGIGIPACLQSGSGAAKSLIN